MENTFESQGFKLGRLLSMWNVSSLEIEAWMLLLCEIYKSSYPKKFNFDILDQLFKKEGRL